MKTILRWIFANVFLGLAGVQSHGAAGDVDPSFDPGSSINGEVHAVALQADGRVLIAGTFSTVPNAMRGGVARLNADGSVDETFQHGMEGVPNAWEFGLNQLAIQNDGKILIDGLFTSINGVARTNIARLNPDGSLDNSFAPPALSPGPVLLSQPDGKILLACALGVQGGQAALMRLQPDGSLDTAFAAPAVSEGADALALQIDGRMVVTGWAVSGNRVLVRLNADGSRDESFAVSFSDPWRINSIALQPDGKILLAGLFTSINDVPRQCLARLNSDGSVDRNFLEGLSGPDNEIATVAVQADGKVLIGGWFTQVNGQPRPYLARLNPDGSADESFLSALEGPDNLVLGFAIQPDSKILVRGFFKMINGVGRPGLARLNSDGSVDLSFLSGRSGLNGSVVTAIHQSDGKIMLAGDFTSIDGLPRTNIARLNPDGSLDGWPGLSFSGGFGAPVHWLEMQPDGKVLLGGSFTTANGSNHNRIARLTAEGVLDTSFTASFGGDYSSYNSQVGQIAVQSDGKILVLGFFTEVNGTARTNLVRLNPDGSLDGSFLSPIGTSDQATCLALQADGRILVGGYSGPNGGALQKGLTRLLPDGTVDSEFLKGSGFAGEVYQVAVQPDGKIVVAGRFSAVNDVTRHTLARLNSDGSLDSQFPDVLAGAVYGIEVLALQPNGKILLGLWFSSVDDAMYPTNIARLNADGSFDADFLAGRPGPNSGVSRFLPQADGRILIIGGFDSVNGIPRLGIARLMGDLVAPALIAGPDSQTAEVGATVNLRVHVSGSPLFYQWFFADAPIQRATNSTFVLSAVRLADAGQYTVAVTNTLGAISSSALLSVIPPVQRRNVPALNFVGQAGLTLHLEQTAALGPTANWQPLDTLVLTGPTQFYFDQAAPLAQQKFYRAWHSQPPPTVLDLHLVPAITLTGTVGDHWRLDYINQVGPIDAWLTLDTVTLTNSAQLYFDTSTIHQPPRLYRLVLVP